MNYYCLSIIIFLFVNNVLCQFEPTEEHVKFILTGTTEINDYVAKIPKMSQESSVMKVCQGKDERCKEIVCRSRQNEVFDPCLGNCEKTCMNIYKSCYKPCVPNCVCKPGFARHNGICVSIYHCRRLLFTSSRTRISFDKVEFEEKSHRYYPGYPEKLTWIDTTKIQQTTIKPKDRFGLISVNYRLGGA